MIKYNEKNYRNILNEYGYSIEEIENRLDDVYNTMFYGPDCEKLYHEYGNDMAYFVDTGNNVKDLVGNNDVLFVESKYYEKLYNNKLLLKTTYIDINTVTGKENVKGYLLNNIVIKKNKQKLCQLKNVLFIFVDYSTPCAATVLSVSVPS